MKNKIALFLCLLVLCSLSTISCSADAPELVVMIYMCGSNLESGYGRASDDLKEMLSAQPDPSKVEVLVMAGGSEAWDMDLDPEKLTILRIGKRGLEEEYACEKRDMGDPDTLTFFLKYCMENKPGNRYALILWDHGCGPQGGVCLDENYSMDSLNIRELASALEHAQMPQKLEWIGFDACMMGSVEVASAAAPYAKYMIASQEKEPGRGWNYGFLHGMDDFSGAAAGKRIIDSYFSAYNGKKKLTLSCVDLSRIPELSGKADALFKAVEDRLDEQFFHEISRYRTRSVSFGRALKDPDLDFDLIDLGSFVSLFADDEPELSGSVTEALNSAVVYSRSTPDAASGLSVYHPYYNKAEYASAWNDPGIPGSFSDGYMRYLNRFCAFLLGGSRTSWALDKPAVRFSGSGQATQTVSARLSEEQMAALDHAELLILKARDMYADNEQYECVYRTSQVSLSDDGILSASYGGEGLYLVDESGAPLVGPIGFHADKNGDITLMLRFLDGIDFLFSPSYDVMITGRINDGTREMEIIDYETIDPNTGKLTARIPIEDMIEEGMFKSIAVYSIPRVFPSEGEEIPGFDQWRIQSDMLYGWMVRMPEKLHLRYLNMAMDGTDGLYYAVFQMTDTQNIAHCTPPLPLSFPDEETVVLSSGHDDAEICPIHCSAAYSRKTKQLRLQLESVNSRDKEMTVGIGDFLLNDTNFVSIQDVFTIAPGKARISGVEIPEACFSGITRLESISLSYTIDGGKEKWLRLGLDLEIEPGESTALAVCEQSGMRISLLNLRRGITGEIDMDLALEATENTAIQREISAFSLNGLLFYGSETLSIEPGKTVYQTVHFPVDIGSCTLVTPDLPGESDVLIASGTEYFDQLTLYLDNGEAIRFRFRDPVQLCKKGKAEEKDGQFTLLDTDDLTVTADYIRCWGDRSTRALLLRIKIQNSSDENFKITADGMLDAETSKICILPDYPLSELRPLTVFADTEYSTWIMLYDYYHTDRAISRAVLNFQIGNMCSSCTLSFADGLLPSEKGAYADICPPKTDFY